MKARRWAPIVFGVAVFVVFVGISVVVLGVAWFREHIDVQAASGASVDAAFDNVRQRFASKAPLLAAIGREKALNDALTAELQATAAQFAALAG